MWVLTCQRVAHVLGSKMLNNCRDDADSTRHVDSYINALVALDENLMVLGQCILIRCSTC